MTKPRIETTNNKTRQTNQQGGCLSGFLLPPLVVLCFGLILAFGTYNLKTSEAQQQPMTALQPGVLAPLFTPEVQFWGANILRWSTEHSINPNITATVMQIESCGNPQALSSAGASGLFQVMPFHFLADEDAFDPDINALRGLSYLAKSLEQSGGDARLALAGYNGGIGVIARSETSWPAETIRYAYWGSGIYTDALQNFNLSDRLDEWLNAGGASLCKAARERLGIN